MLYPILAATSTPAFVCIGLMAILRETLNVHLNAHYSHICDYNATDGCNAIDVSLHIGLSFKLV